MSHVGLKYYVLDEEPVTLDDLPCGTIFFVGDVGAVKSGYRYSNDIDSQWRCVLLASGEYAHFPEKNKTIVTGFVRVQTLPD